MKRASPPAADPVLRAENAALRARLEEAEETLRAIRAGEVDALVVEGDAGPRLFTLQGLDAEQNRLRGEILAQVSEAVIATDREDRITYLNPAAERYYGVRRADMLGRKLGELYTRCWPTPEAEAAALAALEERGHWDGEELHRTRDGRVLPVEASITILRDPDTGERTGVIASLRDITEREQAKQALRARTAELETLLDTLPGFVWIARDAECRVIVGNRMANEFVGVETDANVSQSAVATGEAPYLCQLKENGTEYRVDELPLQRAMATGLPVRDAVLDFHFPDGRRAHVVGDAVPLFDEQGRIRGGLAVFVDITQRKQGEAALHAETAKAVAANAAKDRFLAALSHELRTPLTPVLLISQMHEESQEIPEGLREDFAMIHRNIALEAQLIDDLLDVSRIQQGKMRFDFKPVDMHEAIARALEMLRSEVGEKGIAVRQELRAAPATIEADPARLQQVLTNLLRNAVKFTPRGGLITVRTARDQGALQISLADTGAGIAAEDLERIFQPFEQVEAQQQSEHRSLGLGLAISAAIIAAHRGRIWAESPGPGQGATFHVRLPCEE